MYVTRIILLELDKIPDNVSRGQLPTSHEQVEC